MITEREFFDRIISPLHTEKLKDFFTDMFDSVSEVTFDTVGAFGSMFYYTPFHEVEEFIHFDFFEYDSIRYYNTLIPRALVLTSRVIQPHSFKHSVDNLPQCFKEKYEFVYYLDNAHKETDDFNKKMFFKELIHSFGLTNSYIEFDKVREKKKLDRLAGEVVF